GGGQAPGGRRCEFPVQLAAWTSAPASYAATCRIAFGAGGEQIKKPEARGAKNRAYAGPPRLAKSVSDVRIAHVAREPSG
ncbi:MAG TPA: hypothetical protein VME43_04065, partial [Bryobacteraceae bacterium]|nr:hypothetical protein [Bryobacteraceae bacterium]